jgi:hypothetical protein
LDSFIGKFKQIFKEEIKLLCNLFQKNGRGENTSQLIIGSQHRLDDKSQEKETANQNPLGAWVQKHSKNGYLLLAFLYFSVFSFIDLCLHL